MKTKITKTIEEIAEHRTLDLQEIDIAGKKYFMRIENIGQRLSLNFYNEAPGKEEMPDFQIRIDEEGVKFERYVYRPNHEHGDVQYLQRIVDAKKSIFKPKQQPFWAQQFPHSQDGRDFFIVEFGSITADY